MKKLYDEKYRYTLEAQALDNAAYTALKVIFRECVKAEYSPREIAHVINGVVMDLELESVLGWDKI